MDVTAQYLESRNRLFQQAGVSPQSKFVSTDGPVEKVHYLEYGAGRPLIIIHGGLSHSSEWINIMKPLGEHFHLYVVDRPGHGLSDPINYRGLDYRQNAVDFIRSFMDAISVDSAYLMGNSMGGFFSICFALEYTQKVQKLLLIGAPAGMNLWIPLMLRLLGLRGINWLLMKTVAKPSTSGVRDIHKQILVADVDQVSDDYVNNCYHNMLLPGSETAAKTLLESVLTMKGWRKELYLSPQLKKLTMPVYFIWGDEDAFEKPYTGRQKAKEIALHRFEEIPNAGHCPWFDQPERCTELIIEMLD